jgi:hypothetical protein
MLLYFVKERQLKYELTDILFLDKKINEKTFVGKTTVKKNSSILEDFQFYFCDNK